NKDSILAVDGKAGININGAQIVNTAANGQTQLRSSEGSVNLNTVSVRKDESYGNKSDRDHWISHQSAEIGSQILTQGDISIAAGKQINIRQGEIDSLNGSVNLYGKEDVNISEGRQISDFDQAVSAKSKGLTSSKTNIDKYQGHHNEAVGN
ncbi:hypothetical protein, partial [Snodgrassella alvi]|uniref:hypothetical protein n=1 Tax=Snodgrassella alvi TaxID=1196083 RepID=UPI0015D560B5